MILQEKEYEITVIIIPDNEYRLLSIYIYIYIIRKVCDSVRECFDVENVLQYSLIRHGKIISGSSRKIILQK